MKLGAWIGSFVLLLAVTGAGAGLASWKANALEQSRAASLNQPEPVEVVTAATAREASHRRMTTSIGTVLALRSNTLRNELPGVVREVALTPGEIVEAGAVLVALDVTVERAELAALEAEAEFARIDFERVQRLFESQNAADIEVARTRAARDAALARVERSKAIIERKTVRAPFRARIGMSDVHPGQYLEEGTVLTTLQGVDDAVHVDFTVAQQVAAGLHVGDEVEVVPPKADAPVVGRIVALDARVDATTRNTWVRARVDSGPAAPAPGTSVRVRVPVGPELTAVAVPVSAVRKSPAGDHVFVLAPDEAGELRARQRLVRSGAALGEEMLLVAGLSAGERVAAAGSFKLREAVRVAIAENATARTD